MKKLYQAENGLDAKLVSDLLARFGIENKIHGQYLQGGVGELPVGGFVQVWVHEEDFDEARELVATWETSQPLPDPEEKHAMKTTSPQTTDRGNFVIGFIAAAICIALIAAYIIATYVGFF